MVKDALLRNLLLSNLCVVILMIYFAFNVITKKMIFPILREKKFEKTTPEMVDKIIKFLIGLLFLYAIVVLTIPSAKDFMANETDVVYGVTQNKVTPSSGRSNSIDIITDDGEKLHFGISQQITIDKGTRVKVEYLPNTKEGYVYY